MIARLSFGFLALAACTASTSGGEDYRALPLPTETFPVPQAVFASALAEYPESREGRQELELSVAERDDGTYVVLLTRTGFLDDSVNGDQQRALLRPDGGGWRVTELGERWRCYRGHSDWGTTPCG
jgi:hypothetical protein